MLSTVRTCNKRITCVVLFNLVEHEIMSKKKVIVQRVIAMQVKINALVLFTLGHE